MLEYSNRNLAAAKTRLRKAGLVRSDVASIPCRDSQFDCVVMVRVIHLLPNPMGVMREVLRVTRDGATVIVSVPNLAMNTLLWTAKAKLLPARLRNRTPAFGPAAWPFGVSPRFVRPRDFAPENFELLHRRGTGLLDNAVGRAFNDWKHLYLMDVATSPLWFLKLDVFMKFRVRK